MNALSPDTLFRIASAIAAGGWLLLALAVWRRHAALRDRVAGLAIPALLSLGYSAIVLAHFAGSEGGFSTLKDVAALFRSPWMLLAGWVHYLAFDLLVGASVARQAARLGLPRWLMVPVLPLVFLFGPAGWLSWLALRAVVPSAPPQSPANSAANGSHVTPSNH
jgi:Domain of unknown function (DUF4281)